MSDLPNLLPFRRRRSLVEGARWDLEWQRLRHQWKLTRRWWFKSHTKFQPFFVIATCRSGSNLLLSYLYQDPNIAALSEVLCPQLAIGPSRYMVSCKRAIQHIRQSFQAEKEPIRGAKLMLHQMANCRLTMNKLDAAFPDAKYIILYRQSLADQFVSQQAARETKQFLILPGQERKETQVTIDSGELRSYCDQMRASYREAINHPWLAGRAVLLSYEELTADAGYWLREQICPLLGTQPLEPKTYLTKQSTKPLSRQVKNYSQVAALVQSPICRQQHAWPWEREAKRRAA